MKLSFAVKTFEDKILTEGKFLGTLTIKLNEFEEKKLMLETERKNITSSLRGEKVNGALLINSFNYQSLIDSSAKECATIINATKMEISEKREILTNLIAKKTAVNKLIGRINNKIHLATEKGEQEIAELMFTAKSFN